MVLIGNLYFFDPQWTHYCTMGKRNYAKVPKYRRKRPRLLEVGEFFRKASTRSLPLVPTERIPVGVPVSPSDASPSSARDNGKEQETKPPHSVHNNNDEKDQVLAVEVILDDDNDDEVEEAKILGDSDKQKQQQSLLHVF